MNPAKKLTERLIAKLNRHRFLRELRQLQQTPRLQLGGTPVTLLSQVHQRDVWPYLLALKSIARFLKPEHVVVVCDPSMGDGEREIIARHVPGIEFKLAEQCRDPALPVGGTWERLIAIADLVAQGRYVIQLDADTVTLSHPSEVLAAVAEGESFLLATEDGQLVRPCLETAQWAKPHTVGESHIQVHCEAAMAGLPQAEGVRYMRGCSGFAGFAPYSITRQDLRRLSDYMAGLLGARWAEWGTEQFSSNFVLANSPRVRALPHPRYCHPGRAIPDTVFLHFIGYVRFTSDRYARETRRVVADLQAAVQGQTA